MADARISGPSGPPTPPKPKLVVGKVADRDIACVKLAGTLDEDFDGRALAGNISERTVVLDLGEIHKISSFGIREWIDFLGALGEGDRQILFIECGAKIIDQMNMVGNFAGTGRVFSFYAPYRCDYCDADRRVLMYVDRDRDAIRAMKPPERTCEVCGEAEYFDEDAATYFSYVAGQPAFALPSELSAFLAVQLAYQVADSGQRLRVDKAVEGRATYIGLTGNLDKTFPGGKLAEGLEGIAVIDLSGIGTIDPAGAAAWRQFVQMIAPVADAIVLCGAPLGFVDKLARPGDLGPKTQVMSLSLPYECARCSTVSSVEIDVAAHYDLLKFATAPELPCERCGQPTACAASEQVLSQLAALPAPEAARDVRAVVDAMRVSRREAADSARKGTDGVGATAGAASRGPSSGRGWSMVIVAIVLLAALGAGGLFAYRYYIERVAGDGAGASSMVEASAGARPAWIGSDTPGFSDCRADGVVLRCVGVSTRAPALDAATDEARDAALERLVHAIGERVTDEAWKRSVGGLYAESRAAQLSAMFDVDAASEPERYARASRAVAAGRAAVVASFRATAADAVPAAPADTYWERYGGSGGAGQHYLAFVMYERPIARIDALVASYSEQHGALGVSVVALFPGVAWRFPALERGAVVVAVGDGQLARLGLAERYVITQVKDRIVTSGEAFVRVATEEMERARRDGGHFELTVVTGDGPASVFSQPVDKLDVRDTDGGVPAPAPSGGAVNTWDRVDRQPDPK